MKTKIYEQATAYIESMAKSLGVAAEHVYGILVKQQVAEGIATIALMPLALIILSVILTKLVKALKKYDGWDNTHIMIPTVLVACVLGVASIVALVMIPGGLMKIMNPEYYAIQEIMDVIKGASE